MSGQCAVMGRWRKLKGGGTSGAEISFDTNGLGNIANPDIVQDNTKEAGQKVTWDCIWFGSYPQAKVIPENTDYFPLAGELIELDNLVCDDALFQTLLKATGWDDLGDITIEGNKYRRIRKADATSVPSGVGSYKWKNETEYHFFKYQPIKWRVLSVKDSEAFLLADKALDNKWYHDIFEKDATWEDRMIRSWLNGYEPSENKENKDYSNNNFVNTAFSKSAQSAIKITDVENDNNIYYGTGGGNNTKDKIFLLSESEVYTDVAREYGFVSDCNVNDEARRAKSSIYAKALGTI